MTELDPWLTIADVCRRWKISTATAHRLVRDGRLPAHRLLGARVLRFSREDIEAVERGGRIKPPPATLEADEAARIGLPKDRQELARYGHKLRKDGKSLGEVAELFNRNGWLPNRIPKTVGVKPRADSPEAWTAPLLSQLLTRDYPNKEPTQERA